MLYVVGCAWWVMTMQWLGENSTLAVDSNFSVVADDADKRLLNSSDLSAGQLHKH